MRVQHVFSVLAASILIAIALASAASARAQTVGCAQTYVVQVGDWLSKIAAKYLGDVYAYDKLATATNSASKSDASYAAITNPDLIFVGQKLCIPETASAQPTVARGTTSDDPFAFLPPGKGRDLLLFTCVNCHTITCPIGKQRSSQHWDMLKNKHRGRVSALTEQQLDDLFNYLKENFTEGKPALKLPPKLAELPCNAGGGG